MNDFLEALGMIGIVILCALWFSLTVGLIGAGFDCMEHGMYLAGLGCFAGGVLIGAFGVWRMDAST